MMVGPLVNTTAVVAGSLFGAYLGERVSENMRTRLPLVFGCCSMSLGIVMLGKVHALPAVILAILLGSILGEAVSLEDRIQSFGQNAKGLCERFLKSGENTAHFTERFVPVFVLFCASGTGIFGAMAEGMTGDVTLLLIKSCLDLFTAAIFATSLGAVLAILALPLLAIQTLLFFGASLIMPLTTPAMVGDFSACGGIIMLATGFRICAIKPFAVANMLPALFVVMPISALWMRFAG